MYAYHLSAKIVEERKHGLISIRTHKSAEKELLQMLRLVKIKIAVNTRYFLNKSFGSTINLLSNTAIFHLSSITASYHSFLANSRRSVFAVLCHSGRRFILSVFKRSFFIVGVQFLVWNTASLAYIIASDGSLVRKYAVRPVSHNEPLFVSLKSEKWKSLFVP